MGLQHKTKDYQYVVVLVMLQNIYCATLYNIPLRPTHLCTMQPNNTQIIISQNFPGYPTAAAKTTAGTLKGKVREAFAITDAQTSR